MKAYLFSCRYERRFEKKVPDKYQDRRWVFMVIIHSLTQYVWLEMRHKCHTRMAQFWQNSSNVLSVKSAH